MHEAPSSHPPALSGRSRCHGCLISLAGVAMLAGCSSQQQVTLPPGTPWQEVVKVAGTSTGIFSYRLNNRKYDLVRFSNASTPVVFENQRLFAVVASGAMTEWEKRVAICSQAGGPPLARGVGPLHAFVMAQKGKSLPADKPFGADDAAGLVLGTVCFSPLLLTAVVTAPVIYPMEASRFRRSQQVNDAMVGCGVSYSAFLAHFSKPILEISEGTYQIRNFQANEFSLLYNNGDYVVGTRGGRVLWVSYESPTTTTILHHTYEYWHAHRQP